MNNRPKPTNLKILKGTFEKKRENKEEPKPDILQDLIDPREFLGESGDTFSDSAMDMFNIVAPEIKKNNILTMLDYHALIMLCMHWGEYIDYKRKIGKKPLTKNGQGTTMANPMVAMANTAFQNALKLMSLFGMTPSDRAR